jgi:hypothetical protein
MHRTDRTPLADRVRPDTIARLASTVLAACFLGSCSAPGPSDWVAETALNAPGAKLGGCAAGDLMPEHRGPEIAAVAADGVVYVIWRAPDGDGWMHERAFDGPGEMVQCAVGDADPTHDGDEFIGVGMREGGEESGGPGAVYLVAREEDGWRHERIHDESSLVHGVAIANGAVWVAGFDRKLTRLRRDPAGGWRTEVSVELPGAGKNVLALDEDRIAVACNDGSLVLARRATASTQDGEEQWTLETLHRRAGVGRARLASDGARIVCADDDGGLYLIRPGAPLGPERAEFLHDEDQKLRGAVLADLEPGRQGLEAASAGYRGDVVLLLEPRDRDAESWEPHVILEGVDRLHHLFAADVDGEPGIELVACGFAGRVFVLHRAED